MVWINEWILFANRLCKSCWDHNEWFQSDCTSLDLLNSLQTNIRCFRCSSRHPHRTGCWGRRTYKHLRWLLTADWIHRGRSCRYIVWSTPLKSPVRVMYSHFRHNLAGTILNRRWSMEHISGKTYLHVCLKLVFELLWYIASLQTPCTRDSALVNKLVPCTLIESGVLEMQSFRLKYLASCITTSKRFCLPPTYEYIIITQILSRFSITFNMCKKGRKKFKFWLQLKFMCFTALTDVRNNNELH